MTARRPQVADIPALTALWREAFGDTEAFVQGFFATAFSSARAMCLCDGEAIGAVLYWLDCERADGGRVAYIYAVATAKDHRGRGLCRILMQKTHETLRAAGYAGAILVPGNPSLFSMYEKMGYRTCTYVKNVSALAGGSCVIGEIEKNEYAMLRRTYLPQGGLLQERENMDFLALQMRFYKGDGFIFAAERHDDRLICKEALGTLPPLQEIVGAMDCRVGSFVLMGDEKDRPFAMYHSLDGVSEPPRYLGFAFD